ncbi:MAG: hypothetical protein Q4F17_00705 [Eubacteriales bacterium]|nr:hypothetical protein [Eubacteriales bacterium]
MKSTILKKVLALLLACAATFSLAACGAQSAEPAPSQAAAQIGSLGQIDTARTADSVPTITLYPRDANLTSGLVGGFKGEYFASRGFNVQVWAYSDEKTNAILTSGELPDVMFVPVKDLDAMIESGMLLNLDEYLDDMPHVQSYEKLGTALNYMRQFRSNDTGSVYAMPIMVGDNAAHFQANDPTDRNAVKLLWSAYEKAGFPEVTDMYSLWDVTADILAQQPNAEDGNPMYGTVLNAGSDTSFWACMVMWYRMQGYDEHELPYLLEANMVEGTNSSILSKDSMYYQGLKWYNYAYKKGVIDPDSVSNDRATQKPKVDQGYTITPSGYLPGWATQYMPILVPGTSIYFNYTVPYGNPDHVLAVNAKTENLEACLNFIDMMADPDAYLWLRSGPAGEIWDVDDSGKGFITDKGMEFALEKGSGDMSGFILESGEELALWNTPWIVSDGGALTTYTDEEGGRRPCITTAWQEMIDVSTDNDVYRSWQQATGHDSWMEWLESENAFVSNSTLDYINTFESMPDDMMQLTVDAIKDKVTTASWKMVYAQTDAEFDALWDQMVADCEGLGAQDIIDWRLADIENAIQVRDSLAE